MKKKFAALLISAAMILALPAMAFAAPSPQSWKAADGSATFTGTSENNCQLTVQSADAPAASAAAVQAAGLQEVGTWEVFCCDGKGAAAHNPQHPWSGTGVFAVGTQYNGATAKVFVIHGLDAGAAVSETIDATVQNGAVSCGISGLSFYTVAIDKSTIGAAPMSNSATSPQTGNTTLAVAGATVAMAIAAGAVAVALRKQED